MTSKMNQQSRKGPSAGKESTKQNHPTTKGVPSAPKDILDTLDNFFSGKSRWFYYISVGLTFLLGFLLFDVKVGPGGDDSAYILRAYDFVHSFTYPGYQGPMYPFLLSPFIYFFGIKLPLLKVLSLIFLVVSIIFFYKAFKKRIPGFILSSTLLLISINYFVLYFASQTYSEAFFLMLQAIFLWYFSTRILESDPENWNLPKYIILGLLLFLLTLTKNIALAAVIATAAFFLLQRRWKDLMYAIGSFALFYSLFEVLKKVLWGSSNLQFASQGSGLMYKDFYNPSMGKEDLMGFIQRFIDNSNLYFSKHLYKFLGFRDEYSTDINPVLTVLTFGIIIGALVYCFRKNKLLFFAGTYLLTMCSVEFIVLQKHWDQWRLIIIFYPLFLLMLFSALYFVFKQPRFKAFQFVVPLIALIIFFSSFSVTNDHIKIQRPILERNLKGDLLYGLTPDWVNYIQMSKWAAKNIPENEVIASRKPEISFVYSGRKFFGISKVPVVLTDTFLQRIKPDTSVYLAVRLKRLNEGKMVKPELLCNKLEAVVSGEFSFGDSEVDNSNVICVYKFSSTEFNFWSGKLNEEKIYLDTKIENWLKEMQSKKIDYVISSPDDLLANLKTNKIKYVVLGSLRINPYENTGNIINTIHRYLYFIQLKYPTVFKEINKVGSDEISSLVEINLN